MSCFRNIEDAVKEIDPIAKVTADIPKRLLSVETGQGLDNIRKKIEEAGYPINAVIKE
jgi:copper chaperone CopZ